MKLQHTIPLLTLTAVFLLISRIISRLVKLRECLRIARQSTAFLIASSMLRMLSMQTT